MDKVKRVAVVLADDWEGLYINGKLTYENHNMDFRELLDILTTTDIEVTLVQADDEWLMKVGRYPKDEADVVWAKDE